MDSAVICTVCSKKEPDQNKLATCAYCFVSTHYKCKGIIGNAVHRARENLHFCSPNCASIYQRIVDMQNKQSTALNTVAAELKAAVSSAVSAEMGAVRAEVKSITTAIESSQDFLSSKFDSIVIEFKELKLENDNLKKELNDLKRSHATLADTVSKLEVDVDKFSKNAIENNAVLLGIPVRMNEDVTNWVQKTFDKMDLNLPPDSFLSIARMYTNNKFPNAMVPIRVVFKDKETKERVFRRKKEIGKLLSTFIDPSFLLNGRPTNLILRDELSPLSIELLKEMRESQELLKIKYVWPGRGGAVLIRKEEGAKLEIVRNREELGNLITRFMHQSLIMSSPSPKRKRSGELH